MRYFWIVDSKKPKRGKPCGLLSFDEEGREFLIQISPDATIEGVPMMFIPFIKKGESLIPPEWALEWVKERIPPINRQNIGEILEANGIREYDELTLLVNGEGRCSQDDFMIKEVFPTKTAKETPEGTRGIYDYALVALPSNTDIALKNMVGEQIKKARRMANMSQAELAKVSGVPCPTISRIENGLANPTLETIAALCDGARVHPVFQIKTGV